MVESKERHKLWAALRVRKHFVLCWLDVYDFCVGGKLCSLQNKKHKPHFYC